MLQCPKTRWRSCSACQQRMSEQELEDEYELQSWFIRRINRFLAAQGKQLIGWDEILEGGLAEGACVMSWRVRTAMQALCFHGVLFGSGMRHATSGIALPSSPPLLCPFRLCRSTVYCTLCHLFRQCHMNMPCVPCITERTPWLPLQCPCL